MEQLQNTLRETKLKSFYLFINIRINLNGIFKNTMITVIFIES